MDYLVNWKTFSIYPNKTYSEGKLAETTKYKIRAGSTVCKELAHTVSQEFKGHITGICLKGKYSKY